MTIIFTLREILVERGISERQFAHQAGIREGTLYDICNNEIKRLPIDVIGRICDTLDVDPCAWIKRKKDPSEENDDT